MVYIKKIQKMAIKNYSGMFIEAQMDNLDYKDLFSKIKNETASMISLGTEEQKQMIYFYCRF